MDRSELHGKRLGVVGRVAILRSLAKEPATWQELVQRGVVGATAAITFVTTMHSLGMLRITGWREESKARLLPVYGMGPGEDAAQPTTRRNGRPAAVRCQKKRAAPAASEHLAFFHLYEALQAPSTAQEIIAETGLYRSTVAKALRSMTCGSPRLAYIADWRRNPSGGEPIAVYVWGRKKHAERPTPSPKVTYQVARGAEAHLKTLIPGLGPLHHMARQLAANDATALCRA